MFPQRDIEVKLSLPADAAYWVPKPSDIDEEGLGCYFRDVWPIIGVPTKHAKSVIDWERAAAEYVAKNSSDESEFEAFAQAVESFSPDDNAENDLPTALTQSGASLSGLELGVSGLTHALSNAGFYPAASCRSHPARSWSPHPVVLFASDEQRFTQLQSLVRATGCGLAADGSRGELLFVVYAKSIVELMNLGAALFEARAGFRTLPKTNRKKRTELKRLQVSPPEQPSLF